MGFWRNGTACWPLEAEVGHVLNRSQALGAIWQDCVDAMVRHLGAALAGIWTLDSQQDGLELQASAGLYTHITSVQGPVPFGHVQIGQIAFEKRPYLTNAIPVRILVASRNRLGPSKRGWWPLRGTRC
jgi:GAF domain-containing protein